MAGRERSTAYPSIPLEQAVALVGKIRDALGSGEITREQIAPAIGHEKISGTAASKIGAIAHYGLLDKGKGTYRISPLATRVLSPVSDEERVEALRDAALTPSLFSSIYEKYQQDAKLPQAIEAIMHREYGVTREASKIAHENLVASLTYSGLMDETTREFTGGSSPAGEAATHTPVEPASNNPVNTPIAAQTPSTYQVYELPMSHGTAKVLLPPKLTRKDFDTLQSLVGLIEHFVAEEPAGEGGGTAQEGE